MNDSTQRCTGALDLLPLVAALLTHPRWDIVRQLQALDALKEATCPCLERCNLYQYELLQQHHLTQTHQEAQGSTIEPRRGVW